MSFSTTAFLLFDSFFKYFIYVHAVIATLLKTACLPTVFVFGSCFRGSEILPNLGELIVGFHENSATGFNILCCFWRGEKEGSGKRAGRGGGGGRGGWGGGVGGIQLQSSEHSESGRAGQGPHSFI